MEDFQADVGKSNLELRDKYIRLAREKEAAAIRRKARIAATAELDIQARYPKLFRTNPAQFRERVKALTDIKCFGSSSTPADPIYNGAIQANQWYTRYATMYATAATGDAIIELIAHTRTK